MQNSDKNIYYIVKEHPLRIMSKCRAHSKGTLLSFLGGICLIYALLNWIPELLSLKFDQTIADLYASTGSFDQDFLNALPNTYLVEVIYMIMFMGVFRFGEALYTLTYVRSKKVELRTISEAFYYYFKTLGLFLFQLVIISFWSMFFVIPGIIAAINFSQASYILADDPKKNITRVLAESKIMMTGNRMNYVRLLIYYFPYVLIAYAPAILLTELASSASITGIPLLLISLVAEIPLFLADGYISLGRSVFYELLNNKGFAYFKYAGQDAFRELENIQ